jgi:hypothetical protein
MCWLCAASQTFEKSGLRFSMKAVNASFAAGSRSMRRKLSPSSSICCSTACLLRLLHQPLGLDQAGGRLGGQLARLRLRVVVGLGRRQHAVDQAGLQRGFGHEGLAQQQRLGGAVVAEHLRHQQAGRRLRAQAEVHEGHRERRVVAGIDQVAVEQHGGADAHRRPAHGGQQRLGKGGDAAQEAEHRRVLAGRRLVQEVADVVAGREHGLVALQHDHAHRGVVARLLDRVGQRAVHGRGDGVLALQPVEGDGHHAGFGVGEDVAHAHCSASLTKSRRSWPQNIWSPTKKVGAPNTPRATASWVTALSCSLTSGSCASASSFLRIEAGLLQHAPTSPDRSCCGPRPRSRGTPASP